MLLSDFGRFGPAPLGFDPLAEMRRMQRDINRLFGDFAAPEPEALPALNVWAGDSTLVVTAELPGTAPEAVDVTVREDLLTIRGEAATSDAPEQARWHLRERRGGPFSRTIRLPFRVDPDKVRARFDNGVLGIELERPEQDKPKRIPVKSS